MISVIISASFFSQLETADRPAELDAFFRVAQRGIITVERRADRAPGDAVAGGLRQPSPDLSGL